MATTGKVVALLCLGVLMALGMMAHSANASTSTFQVFSGPGCSGCSAILNACGCSNIPSGNNAGYSWTYIGQTGAAYNNQGCTGVAQTYFGGLSTSGCSAFGWQSVFIQC